MFTNLFNSNIQSTRIFNTVRIQYFIQYNTVHTDDSETIQLMDKFSEIAVKTDLQISYEGTQWTKGNKSEHNNQPLITRFG